MDETQDCISRGLAVDENNAALKTLSIKVEKRAAHLKKIEDDRKERERIEKAKSTAMNMALKVEIPGYPTDSTVVPAFELHNTIWPLLMSQTRGGT